MTVNARQASCPSKSSNKLLAQLPEDDYRRLAPRFDSVRLPGKYVLHTPGAPLEHVYFPGGGVCSVTCMMAGGETVDVAIVGNEELIGISTALPQPADVGLRLSTELRCSELWASGFRMRGE